MKKVNSNESVIFTPEVNGLPIAFSYVRFSTKRQHGGDSLRRQVERSREYAALNGLHLMEKSYEDLGVSAFDRSNLTKGALAAFIQAVESGKIPRGAFLLVENLDRLSRATAHEAVALLSTIINLDIRVVSIIDKQVYDKQTIRDSMKLIYAVIIFVRANEESETKSDRVKKAHQKKRDNRSCFAFGQGPGWLRPNADKTGWESIPEKVASVQKVFELTARGFGATAIARIANKEHWPVPGKAESWHKTLPNKLVHNRRVLGEFEPNIKDGKKRKPTGEIWNAYYPAVISVDLFNAASASAERRRLLPKRRDAGYHNIFQGILHCGHCGATLSRKSKSGSKNSAGYALYVCADRDRGVTRCPNWNARQLEDSLIPPLIECVAAEVLEGTAKQVAGIELDAMRAAIAQGQKALSNLVRNLELTGDSPAVAARIRSLESDVFNKQKLAAQLMARASDPISSVWEEDVDSAVVEALKAVRDVTDAYLCEREALHQSLIRVVRKISVWPRSHATAELIDESVRVHLPLSMTPTQIMATAEFKIVASQTGMAV